MAPFYWERHPDGPFATLIAVATTYLHPESDELESLQLLAKRENDDKKENFKEAEKAQLLEDDGPCDNKDNIYIESYKEQGKDIEAQRILHPGGANGSLSGFIGL